jgi:RimJ/RimL family protein N-acetyltransferase
MSNRLLFPVPSTLETRRLMLRSFRSDDAQILHEALVESIDQLRSHLWFLPWVVEEPTLQSAEARCRSAEANFLLRTDLPFLAFAKETGRLVASVGLHRTDWDIPKTEVGYWVRTSETGKGYASEGVGALTSWALQVLRARRVELVTDEGNARSRAVAGRCGFTLESVLHNVMKAPDGGLRNSCVYAKFPAAA